MHGIRDSYSVFGHSYFKVRPLMTRLISVIEDNYVSCNMNQDPKILRTTLKVSADASFEEFQDAIRAAKGDPTIEVDREWYNSFKESDQIERQRREKMIQLLGPFYNEYIDREDREGLKRKKEINDILHYIQFAGDDDWKIIDIRESPDFIIEVKGEKIGLELTGIYDQGVVAQVNKREKVCEITQARLRETHPEMTGLINVSFNVDQASELSGKVMVPKLVASIEGVVGGEKLVLPTFVQKIDIKSQKTLQVAQSEEYFVKNVDVKALDDLIAQKEAKIDQYKANSGLERIWLLAIIDGASEKSAPEITPHLLPQRKFVFEKVIVYNSFRQIGIAAPPPNK